MKNNVYTLIMAGGKGTRLWPESTEQKPKQYLAIAGDHSLLAQTLSRFSNIVPKENRFIVTTKDQEELAEENSTNLVNKNGLIFEPSGRNTAPCILLSLAFLEAKHSASEDDIVAVMPSDHVILDTNGFEKTFSEAVELATNSDTIATIGIKPHFPHTGYGYIKLGAEVSNGFRVSEFKEKPNVDVATEYLKSGNYLWNAGMFMSSLGRFKEEFSVHAPELFSFYKKLVQAISRDEDISEIYSQLPKDSIDYAIMEKSDKVSIVKADFDWNDLGSWEAMEAVLEAKDGNTLIEDKGNFIENSKGNIVYAPNQHVSLIDVDDLVVVSNDKSLMVVPKAQSQKVKHIVNHLKESGNKDLL